MKFAPKTMEVSVYCPDSGGFLGYRGTAENVTALRQREDALISAKESAELAVLQAYLPARLSADEVSAAVAAIVAGLGASGPGDMGRVMTAVKAQLAGKADMGLVSAAVKAALAK